jgi:hypothetical protein
MVIFEGVTLIYLYNVPLQPHGVYCQHVPQCGDIISEGVSIYSFFTPMCFLEKLFDFFTKAEKIYTSA